MDSFFFLFSEHRDLGRWLWSLLFLVSLEFVSMDSMGESKILNIWKVLRTGAIPMH
jgi:hypothetical protein